MFGQRPLVALIAGLLSSFVVAAAIIIVYADLSYATASIAMAAIAALLVMGLAGSVLVIATGGDADHASRDTS